MNSSGNETEHNKTTSNINELVLHFRICEKKKCENVKSFSGYWKSEIQQRYLIKNAGKTDTTGQSQQQGRAPVGSGAMTAPVERSESSRYQVFSDSEQMYRFCESSVRPRGHLACLLLPHGIERKGRVGAF